MLGLYRGALGALARNRLTVAVALLIAIVAAWFIADSQSLQQCVAANYHTNPKEAAQKGLAGFIFDFRIYRHCFVGWTNRVANAITAVATVVVAAFTFTLWRTGRDQHDRLRDALTQDKEAHERQLRAYVSAEIGSITGIGWRQPPHVKVSLYNTGATPALNVSSWVEFCFLESGGAMPAFDHISVDRAGLTLGPTRSFVMNIMDNFCFTDSGMTEWVEEKFTLVAYGVVVYDDVFGHTWHTFICHGYTAKGEGRYGTTGNETT